MGSYPDLPFGYYVSDEVLSRPPQPRGDPILDLNDNSLLGSFFHGMETNEFSHSYGEGLNFSDQWIGQVAPNLIGHSTSFGPQPPLDQTDVTLMGSSPANWQDPFAYGQPIHQSLSVRPPPPPPPPPPPSQQQQQHQQIPSVTHPPHQHPPQTFQDRRAYSLSVEQDAHADVAAVLTTLHHSGQPNIHARSNSLNGYHQQSSITPPRNHTDSVSRAPHAQVHHDSSIRLPRSHETDMLYTDLNLFGAHEPTAQRPEEPQPLQWGSDGLFVRNQGYSPPDHESSEALEKKRMAALKEALRISNSVQSTRPSSPIAREPAAHALHEHPSGNAREEGDVLTASKKRRTSKARIDVEEDGDCGAPLSSSRTTARKRKSKGDLNGIPELPSEVQESTGKRRKSAPSQPKPPRENLTDAQKRENHIKSEQKRRGAIKEGFEDLTFIVPHLQNGGYSKSTMLLLAGEWLETLINENEKLKA